ncbi:MAG: DUF2272 domain-containing protein [Candidatus Accumulibacter phosphatis]|nr:DUF2272 domain-containing protein [Candidatus Accumulibacter contiguus]
MIRHLRIVLIFALAACGSPPKMPAQAPDEQPTAQETAPQADSPESPESPASPQLGYWRYKIIAAANAEWVYFGQQTVVIDGDDESIPRVGIWEDDDHDHSDRINQYWRAVGKYRLSGYDCREPWSAAFISWIMQTAGVPKDLFPPSSAHRLYLNRLLANAHDPFAVFMPHTIQQYKPQPGDLICATRSKVEPQELVETLPDSLNSRLHCDIVVQTNGRTLQAIGGNVRNSVSKTILTLSPDGYLQYAGQRPWFLIIENRLD